MNARSVHEQVNLDNWPRRRRWMGLFMTFLGLNIEAIVCVSLLGYALDPLMRDLAITMLGAMTTIMLGYLFGAVIDDRSKRRDCDWGAMDRSLDPPANDRGMEAYYAANPDVPREGDGL